MNVKSVILVSEVLALVQDIDQGRADDSSQKLSLSIKIVQL